MSLVTTVDLASKFSAVCVMEAGGEVSMEFDSRGMSAFKFCSTVAIFAAESELLLVEDVPYGISSQAMVKPVLRLQGILITCVRASDRKALDRTLFINPSTWQKTYTGVARGKPEDRVAAAWTAASELGYYPPDLVGQYIESLPEGEKVLKKNTNPLAKNMTDYIDAFLMARWAKTHWEELKSPMAGVQPVFI